MTRPEIGLVRSYVLPSLDFDGTKSQAIDAEWSHLLFEFR